MNGNPHFFDDAMDFAGAMSRLSQSTERLVGEKIQNVIVDVPHPPFATYEHHPVTFRRMWRWGTFSGIVIWSQD